MPNSRAGSRLKRLGPNPTTPKPKPTVASEMATGTPSISSRKNPTSIRMASSSSSNMADLAFFWLPQPDAQQGGEALQQHHEEAEGQQPLYRPAIRESARIG